jgi:CMP-N,N'-diacetyllegionaminic acid synthase
LKILALIPARAGSKRLPGKNLMLLGGKPLIQWSIEAAQGHPEITDILVSTDSADIKIISEKAGATVPWLRPAELASDTATSAEVAIHALQSFNTGTAYDGLLLLQPTSPFRRPDSIRKGIKLYDKSARSAVVGVSPAATHPYWTFRIDAGRLVPFIAQTGVALRSQDLPPAFEINGSFYLIHPDVLLQEKTFLPGRCVGLISEDPGEAIDVDTSEDWKAAEDFLTNRQ